MGAKQQKQLTDDSLITKIESAVNNALHYVDDFTVHSGYIDSTTFLRLLENERFRDDEGYRFRLGLQNLDNWLSLFDMPMDKRIHYCAEMAQAFSPEFDKAVGREIDTQYRLQKSGFSDTGQETPDIMLPLEARERELRKLDLPEENIASYIHMSINRWFNTEQRLMEYMLYRYSEKAYKTKLFCANGQ